MSDRQEHRPTPEQIRQSIFENVQAHDITVERITQIVNLGDYPEPIGIPHNIPASSTVKFVGRSEALKHLHHVLQQNDRGAITSIQGISGVGKTELATQYALLNLLLLTYPGGICWLRARDEDIGIQIVGFAKAKLGLQPPKDWDLPSQVDFCWSHWCKGDVLVVLDDVNDYPKIEPYLPPQPSRFKVLITTRLQLDLSQSLTLDVLGEEAALDLLQQWVGSEKIDQQLADAKKLCQRLGYLPLALNLVGRYVKQRKISLAEMLRRLEEKGLRHKALEVEKKDRTWTLNINRGVAAAFELSWEEVSEDAKQLGCLLSLFALAPIPWDLVERIDVGQDTEELEDARVELESLHLLQGEETYRLHQLIREFFQDKLIQSPWVDDLKQRFFQAMVAEAKKLAREYEELRKRMASGSKRTLEMETIVAQARFLGKQADYLTYDVKAMLSEGTDGERVIALGLLQTQIQTQKISKSEFDEAFDLVLQAIRHSKSAFEQYHALRVAYLMTPCLSSPLEKEDSQKAQLYVTLQDQYSQHIKEGTDRRYIGDKICAAIVRSASNFEPRHIFSLPYKEREITLKILEILTSKGRLQRKSFFEIVDEIQQMQEGVDLNTIRSILDNLSRNRFICPIMVDDCFSAPEYELFPPLLDLIQEFIQNQSTS